MTIKPEGTKFALYSDDGKKLGVYGTLKEAERRLNQINTFKRLEKGALTT